MFVTLLAGWIHSLAVQEYELVVVVGNRTRTNRLHRTEAERAKERSNMKIVEKSYCSDTGSYFSDILADWKIPEIIENDQASIL